MNCVSQSWCMPCQEVAKAIHINKSRPSENNGLKTLTDTLKKTDRWQIIQENMLHIICQQGIQIKTLQYQYTPMRMAKTRTWTTPRADNAVE